MRNVHPRWRRAFDVAALIAAALLVSFAPIADLSASTLPASAERPVLVESQAAGAKIRKLPAGLPSDLDVQRPDDVARLAIRALGEDAGPALVELLESEVPVVETAIGGSNGSGAPYPYRYPALLTLLESAPARGQTGSAAQLGAALIQLAAVNFNTAANTPNAAPAAYALLERARTAGGCAAELNLLVLFASQDRPRDHLVRQQARRASDRCHGDPTAGWILVQFQSQRALFDDSREALGGIWGDDAPEDGLAEALSSAENLRQDYPESADVLAVTGDVHLRAAIRLSPDQPFTGRRHFRLAADAYRQATARGADLDAVVGTARALLGLGEAAAAADLVRSQLPVTNSDGPLLQLLLAAEEAANNFPAARDAAFDLMGAAQPHSRQIFPLQAGQEDFMFGNEVAGPLSTGIVDMSPLQVRLQPHPGGGGATLNDGSLIPSFWDDFPFVRTDPRCPAWSWRRNALLAGDPAGAILNLPEGFQAIRPGARGPLSGGLEPCGDDPAELRQLAQLDSGKPLAAGTPASDVDPRDRLQNMWRWADNHARAARVVERWDVETKRSLHLPQLRRGEIFYLWGDALATERNCLPSNGDDPRCDEARDKFHEAATAFAGAARRVDDGYLVSLSRNEALLGRAAALVAAGRAVEAEPLIRRVAERATIASSYKDESEPETWAAQAYHAQRLLAEQQSRKGDLHAASDDYEAASHMASAYGGRMLDLRPEAVQNNAAIVDVKLNRLGEAEAKARRALAADPENPAFLMTAGFVAHSAGDLGLAVERNTAAFRNDPGAFSAANDLGVDLAALGRRADAETALRASVAANPSFALGWFNLGVLLSQNGALVPSQGALGRAFRLDPSLQEGQRVLTADVEVYRTSLDLSKPIPPGWTLGNIRQREPVAAAGLLLLMMAAIAAARNVTPPGGPDAERWLEGISERVVRQPALARMQHPIIGVAATMATFILPLLIWGQPTDLTQIVGYVVGLLILISVGLCVRQVIARQEGLTVVHRTWVPGLLLGLAGGAAGAPWAALPTAQSPQPSLRLHRAAPVAFGLLAAVLLFEGVWLRVPLASSLGVAAVVMAASLLLPIKPLDGGHLGTAAGFAAFGILGAAALVTLGLL